MENLYLWTYKEYKESMKYKNINNKNDYKRTEEELKTKIERLKEQLKKHKQNKPIKQEATKDGYKKEIIHQIRMAEKLNAQPIHNKDSREVTR